MPKKTEKWRLLIAVIGALVFGAQIALLSAAQLACTPTRPHTEGPFYAPNAPERERTGQGLVVSGTVRSAFDCALLAKARIEWWSASPGGQYDDEHRATQLIGSDGRYRYETDFPGNYGRPLHLHVRVTAPGHRALVTQLYPRTRQASIVFDFVLRK
ncbi:MAG: hypothetical protein O6918_11720 [Deltaproteobacteria bacterium]|nr:hypothetical protein [Deltaproteobacteria bacterium]